MMNNLKANKSNSYVSSAYFVYSPESRYLQKSISTYRSEIKIQSITIDKFFAQSNNLNSIIEHIVVSAPMEPLKQIVEYAIKHNISLGIMPLPKQKNLKKYLSLPKKLPEQLELALQKNSHSKDVIRCNGHLILFKATIGRIPLIDVEENLGLFEILKKAYSEFKDIQLLDMVFSPVTNKQVRTVACGCMIVHHNSGSLASKLLAYDSSPRDGMISLVISAPLSVLGYFHFLYKLWTGIDKNKSLRMPSTIGYIKTSALTIETEKPMTVNIDGQPLTKTPLKCTIEKKALKLNVGSPVNPKKTNQKTSEKLSIQNLPMGKELIKAKKKHIPFFPYASEERFKDLFLVLRDDSRIDGNYISLMVLSTALATIGLYQDSVAVIIGAMLLAPLMSPIISSAMGILRVDMELNKQSIIKIIIGIIIALSTAALFSLLFSYKPITNEMLGRLNPNLFDLGVAIFAGVAGALTKSFKKIQGSIAGVAIAVALVPPLAVAGIGIGRGDPYFFAQAFLLFSTNLVGIILAASLSFRVMGYSAAIKSKRSIAYVFLMLSLLSVPLYLSFDRIVAKEKIESTWKKERFLVNNKYVIIREAKFYRQYDKDIIEMEIGAREHLSREDMNLFKKIIQNHFPRKLIIHATIVYIL